MTTQFIDPITVTDAILDSHSVAETEHPAYSSGTTYAVDESVILNHRVYESQQNSNTGNDPETDDGTWWLDTGPSNAWALFDDKVYTGTSDSTDIVIAFTPLALVNGIAFFGVSADSISIVVDDPTEGEVYNSELSMTSYDDLGDWYGYFFGDTDEKSVGVFLDLPPFPNATITVTIAGTNPSCAVMKFGKLYRLGDLEHDTDLDIKNYSSVTEDEYGNLDIVPRENTDIVTFPINLYTAEIGKVRKRVKAKLNSPLVWIGHESVDETIIYGMYQSFRVRRNGPIYSRASLRVRGMI